MNEPLTPADCDLRDFPFMPLDVVRLRDADLSAVVSGDEFRAAVILWCASWHQVPAASLPDDDIVLANLAGFGRVVREWRKVREGALRGWIKCSDGRLYHPVVAEKAVEAWAGKVRHAHEKLSDRMRKENKKREADNLPPLQIPTLDQWIADGKPERYPLDSPGIPPEKPEHSAGNPAENALIGKGRGKGERERGEGQVDNHLSEQAAAASDAESQQTPQAAPLRCREIAEFLSKLERKRGTGGIFHAADKRLMHWAAIGVSDDLLAQAFDIAVARRKGQAQPINSGLLDVILTTLLHEPDSSVQAQQQPSEADIKRRALMATHAGTVLVDAKGTRYEISSDGAVVMHAAGAFPSGTEPGRHFWADVEAGLIHPLEALSNAA